MKILFQGDSVTDAGRDRNDPRDMGNGYPKYASAMIEDAYPDTEFEFLNLGISGNRTENLLERIQTDLVDIQPDVVSILLGINDVWHRHSHGIMTSDEQFEANYRKILDLVREKTNAKILLMTPFMLYTPANEPWRPEVDRVCAIVRRLAKDYDTALLPLDEKFAEALPNAPEPDFYSADGFHPNAEGACFIGEQYLHALAPLLA